MNRNVLWTFVAAGIYWLAWAAFGTDRVGTENLRNVVAVGGIIVAFLNVLRYLPNAWRKYRSGATAGEWRMLMGLELFWLGFGAREAWLLGGRLPSNWPVTDSPWNGFFAFWILCAGLLCFSAASEPLPVAAHQNIWILSAVGVVGILIGMIGYRLLWG